jgi:hypothetical protein
LADNNCFSKATFFQAILLCLLSLYQSIPFPCGSVHFRSQILFEGQDVLSQTTRLFPNTSPITTTTVNPDHWSHDFSCIFEFFCLTSFECSFPVSLLTVINGTMQQTSRKQHFQTSLCQHRLCLWYMPCQVLPLLLELRFVLPNNCWIFSCLFTSFFVHDFCHWKGRVQYGTLDRCL